MLFHLLLPTLPTATNSSYYSSHPDVRVIIDGARSYAYSAVNVALVQRNWLLGRRIAEEELKGRERAHYGAELIKNLSSKLTEEYGKGFSYIDLYRCVRFYKLFPEILSSVMTKSKVRLSWTHYIILLQVDNPSVRNWYTTEAAQQNWSIRTLQHYDSVNGSSSGD